MIRTQIQLGSEQHEALRKMARSEGLSMSELIRRAVDMLLTPSSGGHSAVRARALAAAGAFASGCATGARDHDDHLAEGRRR